MSERNIDYLVNRLRKRLGDTVKEPRFIMTRYGDGYVWIADPVRPKPREAFLLIGPVHGTMEAHIYNSNLPGQLASSISRSLNEEQEILVCPDWQPDSTSRDKIDYTLELNIHIDHGIKHLALILYDGKSHKIIEKFRKVCSIEETRECIDQLSPQIIFAMWRHAILLEPGFEAGVVRPPERDGWRETAAHLIRDRDIVNSSPEAMIMHALNKYDDLMNSIHRLPLSQDEWEARENEIENLCLRALPDAHGDPRLLLGIARMLRFIDRGYLDLSCRLTDEAFHGITTFAEVFTLKAQIEANKGNIETAIAYYDNSINLVEQSSLAHIQLLILKVIAWMAGGQRNAAYHAVLELHNVVPVDQNMFGLLLIPPDAKLLCSAAENMLAKLSPETGRHLTRYLFRAWARQFQKDDHKKNVMHGLVQHLQRHHGTTAISSEVAERFPKLIMRQL